MGLIAMLVVGLIAGLVASWLMKAKTGMWIGFNPGHRRQCCRWLGGQSDHWARFGHRGQPDQHHRVDHRRGDCDCHLSLDQARSVNFQYTHGNRLRHNPGRAGFCYQGKI